LKRIVSVIGVSFFNHEKHERHEQKSNAIFVLFVVHFLLEFGKVVVSLLAGCD
jgi:hypothetical protein